MFVDDFLPNIQTETRFKIGIHDAKTRVIQHGNGANEVNMSTYA